MKTFLQIIFLLLPLSQIFGQIDKNGNPVFISYSTGEQEFKGCTLISNYYTLQNNIENKLSAKFISEEPTNDDIEFAALNFESDFFILLKERRKVALIFFQIYPEKVFKTMITSSNSIRFYPCKLVGDISENRANEILEANYDSTATIAEGYLKFNGKEFKIMSNQEIEKAILDIIDKQKLNEREPSNQIIPTKEESKGYILDATKEGGRLDFFTEIKGHEYDGLQIKPGVITTKSQIALYKWGRACFDFGINTVEDTYEIFEVYKGKELNLKEKTAIKKGFYREWER